MSCEIETYRGFVYPWQMDHIGHMNVQFYAAKFDEGTWHFLAYLGLTPSYLRDNRRGMVAVDQRTLYKREVLAGSLLVVKTKLLEMNKKSLKYIHVMIDAETGEEVASTELTGVHINSELRKSCEFPPHIYEKGKELLE